MVFVRFFFVPEMDQSRLDNYLSRRRPGEKHGRKTMVHEVQIMLHFIDVSDVFLVILPPRTTLKVPLDWYVYYELSLHFYSVLLQSRHTEARKHFKICDLIREHFETDFLIWGAHWRGPTVLTSDYYSFLDFVSRARKHAFLQQFLNKVSSNEICNSSLS